MTRRYFTFAFNATFCLSSKFSCFKNFYSNYMFYTLCYEIQFSTYFARIMTDFFYVFIYIILTNTIQTSTGASNNTTSSMTRKFLCHYYCFFYETICTLFTKTYNLLLSLSLNYFFVIQYTCITVIIFFQILIYYWQEHCKYF